MPSLTELAIVVCTRERPVLLAGALAAIRRATPVQVEVIVVDSASTTAATREVALTAGMRYIRSEVPGLSIARNLGLLSTGRRYVLFTDDDCRPIDGWVDAILSGFADGRVGAVTGLMLSDSPDETAENARPGRQRTWQISRPIDGLDGGHGAIMAFDREFVLEIGGFDETLGAGREFGGAEDLDMFCRVLCVNRSIIRTADSMVRHINVRLGEEYALLHFRYGLGLGAMTNKWIRRRPMLGLQLSAVLAKRTISRSINRADGAVRRQAAQAMLRGIIQGFARASRSRLDGDTFVDSQSQLRSAVSGNEPLFVSRERP